MTTPNLNVEGEATMADEELQWLRLKALEAAGGIGNVDWDGDTYWWVLAKHLRRSARHRSPHVLGCVEDYLAGRRLPLDAITTDPTVYDPEIKR